MSLKKFKGFKLISLEVNNHKILGVNTFNFIQEEDNNDSIYATILIGPNGTGKSEILKLIINIFRNLSLLKNGQKEKNLGCQFKLKFKNTHEYTFSNYKIIDSSISTPLNYKREYTLRRYGELIDIFKSYDEVDDYKIPNITASSFMLSDKFFIPITDNDKNYFKDYNYLGLKSNRQSGSTQRLLRRTVDHIVDNENPEVFQNSITKIGNFLEFDTDGIEVTYKTKYTNRFWNGDLTPNILEDFFHEITVQYEEMQGKQAPFKLTNYRTLKSKGIENIESLCNYMNQMSTSTRLIYSGSKRSQFKTLTFNVAKSSEHQRLSEEKKTIEYAIDLGFLEAPQINFISSSKIPIDQASSGEINLFATMIGLISTIKYGSLIIIDEPEVSLHPNWQMKYLHFLTELLNEYNDSHIVIATHSHFLISDLQGDTGKIIGLKKTNRMIETVDIDRNTFGWSAEEVLYKIFDVRTTRNHYLEMDIRKMLGLIAEKSDNVEEIKNILFRVSKVQLNEYDPLGLIINQAKEYIA
jgi:predicted ATPase